MDKDLFERRRKETLQSISVYPFSELPNLPEGIGFGFDEGQDRGTDLLGGKLKTILQKYATRTPTHWVQALRHEPKYLLPLVLSDYGQVPLGNEVLGQLLSEYPNISWIRGEGLQKTPYGNCFDRSIFTTGADGLLGDMRAVRYAWNGYDGPREHPALAILPLKDIFEGIKGQKIEVGTHHGYDVTIKSSFNGFSEWIKSVLRVYQLPSGQDEKHVLEILRQKQIPK